jgi:hypothetical protein
MLTMPVIPIGLTETEGIAIFLSQIRQWSGSLEDASVILLAQTLKCPVWTTN